MKKFYLTVLLCIALIFAVALTASAEGTFEVNAVASSAVAGGTMTLDVTVDNITVEGGIESVDFVLAYSSNVTYSSISANLPTGWTMWPIVSNTSARTLKIAAVN
jgi:hypothetical protein